MKYTWTYNISSSSMSHKHSTFNTLQFTTIHRLFT